MKKTPLVTVYLPSRNYGSFLRQSIESVINQIYENWELFIFDENSEDDTSIIAKEFEYRYPNKISYIKNPRPIGLQKIANHALKIAKGKYFIRLDADDWLNENALLVMVAKLESSKGIGLVYPNYFYTDERGNVIGTERRYDLGENQGDHLPPHGACTMVRSRCLKSVGGYDEKIDAQDGWDLWYKLFKRTKAAAIDLPLFYYRQHGKSLSTNKSRLLDARTKIFNKPSKSDNGDYEISTIAILPVRESFPGFSNIPFRKIGSKTLLEVSSRSLFTASNINDVIIASDSKEVLDKCNQLEKTNHLSKHFRVLRKDQSKNKLNIQETMKLAGECYYENKKHYPDIVLLASLHAVNRKSIHVDQAINILKLTESDCIFSVQEEREPIFNYGPQGLNLINPGRFKDLTYDREKLFRFNGSIIAAWWDVITDSNLLDGKISFIEMTSEDSFQIKREKDLIGFSSD